MVIAMLTDFDGSDGLGLVKGVIYSICPDARIVDLYNNVQPFQVRSGAWILLQDYKYFPKGTIFFAVVDPGVGGRRRAIAVRTKNYLFVGPDNGLMFPAAAADGGVETAVELPIPHNASKTFHGRDVFAPAAAKLEKGIAIKKLGKVVDKKSLQQLRVISGNGEGEVVVVEHYGNIVTSIPATAAVKNKKLTVKACGYKNNLNYHETYEQAKDGELFVITGSRNTLELSVRNGSAAAVVKAKVGDEIIIK